MRKHNVPRLVLVLGLIFWITAAAQTTPCIAETIECIWDEAEGLDLNVWVDPAIDEDAMWVLTVLCTRFEDGLFAWQLHVSSTLDSLLVLPNDFLTARHFTTAQLGITVHADVFQGHLALHVPIDTPIPRLIAPGDVIELHALWIQQAPIAVIPVVTNDVSLAAASVAGSGGGLLPPDSFLPAMRSFAQGEPLVHHFVPDLQPLRPPFDRLVLSYTLMRLPDDLPPQLVRFSPIAYDEATGSYRYEIDTTMLAPGRYRLIIGATNANLTERAEFVVSAAEPTD